MREFPCRCVAYGLMAIPILVLSGCPVAPTSPADISAYNDRIFALWQPFLTPLALLVGFLGMLVKQHIDRKAQEKLTIKAVTTLAESTSVASDKVIEKISETHAEATAAAARAPHRSTDLDPPKVLTVPLDKVQKVEITPLAAKEKSS